MQSSAAIEEVIYLDHLGLKQNPFPVAPDEENFYLSPQIDQVLTNLVHGVLTRKGFMVLTGDVGLGKTTISRRLIRILERKGVETSLVFHTSYQDVELLNEINRDFGLQSDHQMFSDQMNRLNQFLIEKNRQQKNCAIIIDDAQNLSSDSLELIRMISNLETDRHKLVQILLIGQPELRQKLASRQLRQLQSRVVIKEEVKPLTRSELHSYLSFKLNAAGAGATAITSRAVKAVFAWTRGNFRKVNLLMDRCLYVAFFHNSRSITHSIVRQAIVDMHPSPQKVSPKYFLLAASVSCLLLAAAGLAYFGSGDLQRSTTAGKPGTALQSSAVQPVSRTMSTAASTSAPLSDTEMQSTGKPLTVPAAVVDFMNAYALEDYVNDFYHAFTTQRFEDFSALMRRETGLELIRLKHLPNGVRSRYGVLTHPSGPNSAAVSFLFWKPPVVINTFYYAYRGEEIRRLQEMLAKLRYYRHGIDGIVGKNLMQAVLAFQNQMRLPLTGLPDPQTLFLIDHFCKG